MAIIIIIVVIGVLLLISTGRIHRIHVQGLESPMDIIPTDYSLSPQERVAINWFKQNCYIVSANTIEGEQHYIMDVKRNIVVASIDPYTYDVTRLEPIRSTRRRATRRA